MELSAFTNYYPPSVAILFKEKRFNWFLFISEPQTRTGYVIIVVVVVSCVFVIILILVLILIFAIKKRRETAEATTTDSDSNTDTRMCSCRNSLEKDRLTSSMVGFLDSGFDSGPPPMSDSNSEALSTWFHQENCRWKRDGGETPSLQTDFAGHPGGVMSPLSDECPYTENECSHVV